jgi:hypothetical protein
MLRRLTAQPNRLTTSHLLDTLSVIALTPVELLVA